MTELILYPLGRSQFRGEYAGETIVERSEQPGFDACRVLAGRGVTGKLRVRHDGAKHWAFEIDIERGAKLVAEPPFIRPIRDRVRA